VFSFVPPVFSAGQKVNRKRGCLFPIIKPINSQKGHDSKFQIPVSDSEGTTEGKLCLMWQVLPLRCSWDSADLL